MTRRTPWFRAVTALGALAVTALITSCAGPSTPLPTMADEQRADTVTVPAGTWTPTPIDVLTEIPPEAAQRTPAGAEAYVQYYFDTLNHLSMNPQTGHARTPNSFSKDTSNTARVWTRLSLRSSLRRAH